jgi:MinD superfamily P-loop ATPase
MFDDSKATDNMKIAISSGKGGTGKTTIAANLALYLAEKSKVCLADLDVEEPDSGLFIRGEKIHSKIKSRPIPSWDHDMCTASDRCGEVCNFNAIMRLGPEILVFPELCHSCNACVGLCPSGALKMSPRRIGELNHYRAGELYFVEGNLDIGQEQAVPLIAMTKEYAEEIAADGRIILYDTPPGTSCPVIEAVKDADMVLLVAEPTPFGLHDLSLASDVMVDLGKDFAVVLNRFGIGDSSVEEYCESKNIPIIALVKNDRKVAEIYSRGHSIYDKNEDFRKALEDIENYIGEHKK